MHHINRMAIYALAALSLSGNAAAQTSEERIAAANAKKAEAEAETAASNADKAKYTARSEATKSRFGSLSDYTREGSVKAGDAAGTFEAALMSADATREASAAIVSRLLKRQFLDKVQTTSPVDVVVVSSTFPLEFDAYVAFQAQASELKSAFDAAIAAEPKPHSAPRVIGTGTSAGALTGLAVVGNLFRSDYDIDGIKLEKNDKLLMKAFLRSAKEAEVTNAFYVPSMYTTWANERQNPAFRMVTELRTRERVATQRLEDFKKAESKKLDYSGPISKLENVLKRYGEFMTKISTADEKGAVLLAAIAKQSETAERLKSGGRVLILQADVAGGSAYTKKNFWTFLGELPFSVSAGTVASFALIDGPSGQILDSGVLGFTQPYMKVKEIARQHDDGNPPGN